MMKLANPSNTANKVDILVKRQRNTWEGSEYQNVIIK